MKDWAGTRTRVAVGERPRSLRDEFSSEMLSCLLGSGARIWRKLYGWSPSLRLASSHCRTSVPNSDRLGNFAFRLLPSKRRNEIAVSFPVGRGVGLFCGMFSLAAGPGTLMYSSASDCLRFASFCRRSILSFSNKRSTLCRSSCAAACRLRCCSR